MEPGVSRISLMRPRFTIAALVWFTAIVAIAAALPRRRHWVAVTTGDVLQITRLDRPFWPLGWELLWRGAVVVVLCLIVWLLKNRGRGLPPY
jgi:hypothetical protein